MTLNNIANRCSAFSLRWLSLLLHVLCGSVLLPEINCMHDLMRYYRRQFRYFINLTGQEFPLRTNLELVRIARIFNGSNDVAGSFSR